MYRYRSLVAIIALICPITASAQQSQVTPAMLAGKWRLTATMGKPPIGLVDVTIEADSLWTETLTETVSVRRKVARPDSTGVDEVVDSIGTRTYGRHFYLSGDTLRWGHRLTMPTKVVVASDRQMFSLFDQGRTWVGDSLRMTGTWNTVPLYTYKRIGPSEP